MCTSVVFFLVNSELSFRSPILPNFIFCVSLQPLGGLLIRFSLWLIERLVKQFGDMQLKLTLVPCFLITSLIWWLSITIAVSRFLSSLSFLASVNTSSLISFSLPADDVVLRQKTVSEHAMFSFLRIFDYVFVLPKVSLHLAIYTVE